MTPDRAASIFRDLLMTPASDLDGFARRVGLQGNPDPGDLKQAKEILETFVVALQSGPGPNWQRVNTMWSTLHARHGALAPSAMEPQRPGWVRPAPPKPSLGDAAPGTAGFAEQQERQQRFVPGRHVQPGQIDPRMAPKYDAPGYDAQQHAAQGYGQPGAAEPPPPPGRDAWPAPPGLYGAPPMPYAPQPAQEVPAPQVYRPPPPKREPPPPQEPQAPTGNIKESVARYASFCAACAAAPDRVFATMVEYGISSPQARDELDELWNERFDGDAGLQKQWEQLFHQFRDKLRQRG
jgi:hypothetical protein